MIGRMRHTSILCALGVCVAWPKLGYAEGDAKRRCVVAYEDAQSSKHNGKLIEARDKLLFCSSPQCPELMHRDCQRWLDDVEASIPTVVFRVETAKGVPVETANASIDGGAAIELGGRAVGLDPGRHSISFTAKGFLPLDKTIELSEGEKLRREIAVLAPIQPSAPPSRGESHRPSGLAKPDERRQLTWPIVVSASAALLGVAGTTYFGLKARSEEGNLDSCDPNCTDDSVDRVKRDYLLANASIGLAATGLVVTTVLLVLEFRTPDGTQSARLGVRTSQHHLSLSLGGSF